MILPNARLAVVDERKVADYLLNGSHPDNGGKAQFFHALGYSNADPSQLAAALRGVAVTGNVVSEVRSEHGNKYVVDGQLRSLFERRKDRLVRTVWIVELGDDAPRLVTAYPHAG